MYACVENLKIQWQTFYFFFVFVGQQYSHSNVFLENITFDFLPSLVDFCPLSKILKTRGVTHWCMDVQV